MLRNYQSVIQMFRTDFWGGVIYTLMFAAALLISLILHEIGHGRMALRCGDPTAKMMGRLSLNPMRHLHPIGTLLMVLVGFGWAQPVPVNPRNFTRLPWQPKKKDAGVLETPDFKKRASVYRTDSIMVSAAGILVNLGLFLLCMLLSVVVLYFMAGKDFALYVSYTNGSRSLLNMADKGARESIYWLFVNYQLDGLLQSELTQFMALPWLQYFFQFLTLMCSFNISLALFNLIPVPPLDGYRLLNDTVFRGKLQIPAQFMQMLPLALLLLCWTGLLDGLLSTCMSGVYGVFVRLFLNLIPA